MFMEKIKQSQMNIGTLGHVDHGKTTLTFAITHAWTDVHSESIKRSMTIKLGYSDATIYRCGESGSMESYITEEKCKDGKDGRRRSGGYRFSTRPGHETLMATAIAGSNIIDAALFVIAATEPCPMPQTKEHLMLINALGIRNVIVVQTKVDIVGKEQAMKHHAQIRNFIKGSSIENAEIIPVMPNKNINVDAVLEAIVKMELPKRDTTSDPTMYVARSFDVNRPGTKMSELLGGVVGGSIIKGKLKVGDEIEIRPGINTSKGDKKKVSYSPIITTVESLLAGKDPLDEAIAGGLIAVGTDLDPSFTKADALVGQMVGRVGKLPGAGHGDRRQVHLARQERHPEAGLQAQRAPHARHRHRHERRLRQGRQEELADHRAQAPGVHRQEHEGLGAEELLAEVAPLGLRSA